MKRISVMIVRTELEENWLLASTTMTVAAPSQLNQMFIVDPAERVVRVAEETMRPAHSMSTLAISTHPHSAARTLDARVAAL